MLSVAPLAVAEVALAEGETAEEADRFETTANEIDTAVEEAAVVVSPCQEEDVVG